MNNNYFKSVLEGKVGHTVFNNGTELPQREILNIKEPLVATDDPVNKQTNVSINVDTDALDLSRFIPPTRASGSSRLLGALNDVSIDRLEEGQFLQYINEKWINRNVVIPEVSGHKLMDNDGHELSQMQTLQFLAPFKIQNNFEDNKTIISVELPNLETDGLDLSKFIPPSKGRIEYKYIGDLLDTDIYQVEDYHVLQYINGKWRNTFMTLPEKGHIILDENGTELSQRRYFQIKGPLKIENDFLNDATVLSIDLPELDCSGELDLSKFIPPSNIRPEYKYLRDLIDVLVDDVQEGEYLQFKNNKWTNTRLVFPSPIEGHILLDKDDNELAKREKIKFNDPITAEDDPINDTINLGVHIDSDGELDLDKFIPPQLPTGEFRYFYNLNDTGIVNPVEGQTLEYIGGKWVNITKQITLIKTLEAGENDITFNNIPTDKNYILDFYTTKEGLEYVSLNDATAGVITYTFEEQEEDVDCMLVIKII